MARATANPFLHSFQRSSIFLAKMLQNNLEFLFLLLVICSLYTDVLGIQASTHLLILAFSRVYVTINTDRIFRKFV